MKGVNMVMFYLLSLLTGVLECGWIAYGAANALPLWEILCYPLAYHFGNLFPKPFSLSRNMLRIFAAVSAASAILPVILKLSEFTTFILTCMSLFLLSAVIQSVRSGLKSDGNRLLKRVFRIGGFALAPLAALIPFVILFAASLAALYALNGYQGKFDFIRLTAQNGYSATMIFHQLHYFFYAHITLAAMSLLFAKESGFIGVWSGALLFCGTWVTYMSVEPIFSKRTPKLLCVFYAGHIGISILLFAMSLITCKPLFIFLWVMTGFGGGVVYTISAKAKKAKSYDKDSMTVSENIGHTAGLLIAVGAAAVFGAESPQIMLVFGSVSAVSTVISMIFNCRKEDHNETVRNKG